MSVFGFMASFLITKKKKLNHLHQSEFKELVG